MKSKVVTYGVLTLGALAFLFPFYYMVVGSLQTNPDTSIAGAFPHPSNLTLENYTAIDGRINLLKGLVNSGIFTGGVILGTIVFGVLAGYALAVLKWRGRSATFALVLLVQVIPFRRDTTDLAPSVRAERPAEALQRQRVTRSTTASTGWYRRFARAQR